MFKIIEMEINHNIRLKSGLIEGILYKPESPYQVIVGPNGVGKSALLDEITGYPSLSSAFEKGGLSRAKFETDEGIVETKTIVSNGTRHEFWKGGENLNTGGTAGVQKDLVLTHLKVNDLAFEIATNKVSFSRMTPVKRQEILSQLANNDMGYGYNLFIKAKKKLSHAIGARNALEETLTEKKVSNVSDEEVKALEGRLTEYNTQVMSLLTELQESTLRSNYPTSNDWVQLKDETERLRRQTPRTPLNALDRSEYVERINAIEITIRDIKTQHSVLQEQYDSLDDVIKRSADSSEENITARRAEVLHWEEKRLMFQQAQFFAPNIYPEGTDFSQVRREVQSVWDQWRTTLGEMEPDSNDEYNRENFNTLKATQEKYQQHMNSLTLKRSRYLEQLEHLEKGVKVDCPGCGLHFTPGVTKGTEARVRQALEELNTSILKGEEALVELSAKIQKIETWIQLYKEKLSLEKVCPSATAFFSEIAQRCEVKKQPSQALTIAIFLFEDLEALENLQYAIAKEKESRAILSQLEANNVKGLGNVIAQHQGTRNKIEVLCFNLKEQEKTLSMLQQDLSVVTRYQENVESHGNRYNQLLSNTQEAVEAIFNETRRILIQDLQAHIGTLTKTLNNIKSLRDQIVDTERQLVKQRELILGYTHLVEGLSPKTGVVAEQMSEFIDTFVEQMNKVIEAVWTYEMEILPGRLTDNEISYIFPIRLHGNNARLVPDLKEASDGQKEIIDFSFKITAMLYLNQVDVPLLLDEVDRPLGPVHKERLMRFITQAVENGRFSQVFLISHHASSHGALPYPDMVDFDFRNPQPESNRVAFFQ